MYGSIKLTNPCSSNRNSRGKQMRSFVEPPPPAAAALGDGQPNSQIPALAIVRAPKRTGRGRSLRLGGCRAICSRRGAVADNWPRTNLQLSLDVLLLACEFHSCVLPVQLHELIATFVSKGDTAERIQKGCGRIDRDKPTPCQHQVQLP